MVTYHRRMTQNLFLSRVIRAIREQILCAYSGSQRPILRSTARR